MPADKDPVPDSQRPPIPPSRAVRPTIVQLGQAFKRRGETLGAFIRGVNALPLRPGDTGFIVGDRLPEAVRRRNEARRRRVRAIQGSALLFALCAAGFLLWAVAARL